MKTTTITAIAFLLLCTTARAGDERTITVSGRGTATAPPTSATINFTLMCEGDDATEALKRYNTVHKDIIERVAETKVANVEVKGDGLVIEGPDSGKSFMEMQQQMMGQAKASDKPAIRTREKMHVIISNIDKQKPEETLKSIQTIIDACRANGIHLGDGPVDYYQMQMQSQLKGDNESGVVTYQASLAELRERASKAAMDDAAAKAKRIAELAGGKVGPVRSVREAGLGTESAATAAWIVALGASRAEDARGSIGAMREIRYTTDLTVEFTIQP